jgi:acetyltransferase
VNRFQRTSASVERAEIVELRDRTRALIRPIGPSDRQRLNEGFESASPDSNFLRFLSPKPRLSSSELVYLTAVDHVRHEALIAVDPETGQSFGTARYIRSAEHPETAEFAIGVGDRWMRIGLGTALLRALVLRAREAGVKEFTGLIRAENTAVKRLIEKVLGDYETRLAGQGAMEVVVDLRAAPRGRPTAGSLRRFLLGDTPLRRFESQFPD